MTNQEIFEMADKLKAAKDRKKELDAQVKEVTAEIDECCGQAFCNTCG